MKKVFILSFIGFFVFIIMLMSTVVVLFGGNDDEQENGGLIPNASPLSDEVLAYKSTVEKYCKEYDISEYVMYILAIMQVESGGRGEDVMQASESLGLPLNSLNPEESIKQGCSVFAEHLQKADRLNLDTNSVIQAYNYGGGFLDYVANNGGEYTFALAEAFSKEQADGVRVDYRNAIAIDYNGGYRYDYGNMFYVTLITSHLISSSDDFIFPTNDGNIITSVYGNRIHPISGRNDNHSGIDIAAPFGTNVLAIADGTVTLAEYHNSYGNYVIIDHGNGFTSLYAHNSRLFVNVGDRMLQGMMIAQVGSTGDSTGPHIHLEIWLNGERTDPLSYYPQWFYTF